MAEKQNRFMVYTDEQLMQFIVTGEVGAFDELYARYSKRLLLYFHRMLNFDKALAEDALQDLFLKIAENPDRFDNRRSFRTWVYCIASNSCKNFYRHQVVKNRYVTEGYAEDEGESLHLRIDKSLFMNSLYRELGNLPLEKREAFILRYQEDKTMAEIAEIQGVPEGSVKSRLFYTLRLLEEKLKIFNPSVQ
jgi:RNA polymerase sigma-70 factor (ECF subfamily)